MPAKITKHQFWTSLLLLVMAILMTSPVQADNGHNRTNDIAITKTVDNSTPHPGDTIVYTITATNNGPDAATDLRVWDVLPSGVTYVSDDGGGRYNRSNGRWNIDDLPAGSTMTLHITATVDAGASGTITNTATLSVAGTDPDQSNNSASADITIATPDTPTPTDTPPAPTDTPTPIPTDTPTPVPTDTPTPVPTDMPTATPTATVPNTRDLAVTKTVDNAAPNAGATIVYTINATNNGLDVATDVSVSDVLPTGLTYVSDDSSGAYDSTTGVWAIGDLAGESTVTLHLTATVDPEASGTITNSATISGAEADDIPDNNSAIAILTVLVPAAPVADLAVTKTVDNAAPSAGDTIVYTIIASNNGPDGATGVSVSDVLPTGLTYVSADPSGVYDSATGVWTIGDLAAGSTATLHLTATVAPEASGTITNTATISGVEADSKLDNNSASATLTVNVIANVVIAALPSTSCTTSGTDTTCTLYAVTGLMSLPGESNLVPVWGYNFTGDPATQPGGPVLIANEGDTVTVNLINNLPTESTALLFQGQEMIPDLVGAPAVGGTQIYTFTAKSPGTYLYEAGLLPNAEHQVAMGLYGALVVQSANPGIQAYDSAATDFNDENVFLLSEIDPALNKKANPATFDMRNYKPRYWLINGQIYPNTGSISTAANARVLLRYVNAGLQHHSMAVLGLNQTLVAVDGSLLPHPQQAVAETLAPGQTADAITTIPAAAGDGSQFALYDASLLLHSSNTAGFGGMLTFLTIPGTPPPPGPSPTPGPPPPADTTGPATSGLALSPNPTNGTANVALSGTANDSATGGSNIAAAEYTIDGGSAVPMTVNPTTAPVASLSAAIPAASVNALAQGSHTVSVRSQDLPGNWGTATTINLTVDKTGPATGIVSVQPASTNGTTGLDSNHPVVRVTAKFTDTLSNISAAEGFIDTVTADGTGFPFLPSDGNFNSLIETGYVDIPLTTIAQLSSGNHTICVHSKDAAGNWGQPCTSVNLLIDRTPPTFTGIMLAPNPTLGATSVTLTVIGATDPLVSGLASGVAGGEYWFGTTNPAPGGGTAFTGLSANIPVGSLLPGTYTVRARIRDAAGNWSTNVNGTTLTVSQPPIYFSTSGTTNPPGVGGTADDADIYFYNGAAFSRSIDASAAPYNLPASGGGNANVDGFDRVDATHFYMSFTGQVNVPGLGNVQDEDVVFYNAGTWSLFFDGSLYGLGGNGGSTSFDLDAISIVGGTLYFSTDNNNVPPGAGGTGDDADIYRWNGGSSYTRMVDASAVGWSTANVDGLVWVDATHVYLSYSTDTTVPVIGGVQDEDVVRNNGGTWSVYFDGTSLGLTSGNLDIDAFDLP